MSPTELVRTRVAGANALGLGGRRVRIAPVRVARLPAARIHRSQVGDLCNRRAGLRLGDIRLLLCDRCFEGLRVGALNCSVRSPGLLNRYGEHRYALRCSLVRRGALDSGGRDRSRHRGRAHGVRVHPVSFRISTVSPSRLFLRALQRRRPRLICSRDPGPWRGVPRDIRKVA